MQELSNSLSALPLHCLSLLWQPEPQWNFPRLVRSWDSAAQAPCDIWIPTTSHCPTQSGLHPCPPPILCHSPLPSSVPNCHLVPHKLQFAPQVLPFVLFSWVCTQLVPSLRCLFKRPLFREASPEHLTKTVPAPTTVTPCLFYFLYSTYIYLTLYHRSIFICSIEDKVLISSSYFSTCGMNEWKQLWMIHGKWGGRWYKMKQGSRCF